MTPTEYAHRSGVRYAETTDKSHKKTQGQFFTPVEVAAYMAAMVETKKTSVAICDPGCGQGILTCALVEKLASTGTVRIHIDLFETDQGILPVLKDNLRYLAGYFDPESVRLTYQVHDANFLVWVNQNHESVRESYDYVISNPPYYKLNNKDIAVKAVRPFVSSITNIYAGFIVAGVEILKADGELVFIVPRSFTSGLYFKTLREYLFKQIRPKKIHLFESRTDTFRKDKVLQETLIFKADNLEGTQTEITVSDGLEDISHAPSIRYQITDLVDLDTEEKILHLPQSRADFALIKKMRSLKYRLKDHRVKVSTGRVVAFRAESYISEEPKGHHVPLLWMNTIQTMRIDWPLENFGKPQYIDKQATSLLVPNGNYILQRRFSAKEDKRRLVCAPLFENQFDADYLGFENKTNFFYKSGGKFDADEMMGISVLLNSKLYDSYFRLINGNINVSSSEMNLFPFPSLKKIKEIGAYVLTENLITSVDCYDEVIDKIVFSETAIRPFLRKRISENTRIISPGKRKFGSRKIPTI